MAGGRDGKILGTMLEVGGHAQIDIRYTNGITSGVRDQEQPRTMQEEARPPRQAVYLSQVLMGEGRKSDALSE